MGGSLGLRQLLVPLATAAALAVACGDLVMPGSGSDSSDASTPAAAGGDAGTAVSAIEVDASPPLACDGGVYPVALACTGLYTDWPTRTVAPDVQTYHPGATLWADGAVSTEWVWLPPGAKIDTRDLNGWVFPVGTKFWQQMTLLGAPIETRFLWKMAAGQWFRSTYAWTPDGNAAPELTAGSPNAGGLPYDIPSVSQCDQCHDGAADFVLGFETVGLAMPTASGLDLQALVQGGVLSNPPASTPVIPGADAATAASLAFLHTNCGVSCHNRNPDANAGPTGLFLKLVVGANGALPAAPDATDTWVTSVNVSSTYTPAGADAGGFWRIRPGDPDHSTIPWRAARRNTAAQMPPIDTELPDQSAVMTLQQWVGEMGDP